MGTKLQTPLDIPLTMGIRQDFEVRLAPPGALVDATNLQYDKNGRLERREPFNQISTSKVSKTNTYTGPARRFATGAAGENLIFADENVFTYFPTQLGVSEAGRRSQVSTLRATLQSASYLGADPAGQVLFADAGYAAPWLVTAYMQKNAAGTYSIYVDITNTTTNARAWTAEKVVTSANANMQPRVLVTGSVAWVFWAATSGTSQCSIVYERIDLTGPTIGLPGGGVALVTDARTANPQFDVVPTAGGFVIAYVFDNGAGGNAAKLSRWTTAAPPVQLGATYTWNADPGAVAWASTTMALRGAVGTERIMALGWAPALGTLQVLQIDFDLTNPFFASFNNTALAASDIRQSAMIRLSSTITLFAYSEYGSVRAADPRGHLWYGTITYNGLGPTVQKSAISVLPGYSLGSRFYTDPVAGNGYVYSVARFSDGSGPALNASAQSHFLMLDWGNLTTVDRPTPQGYVASGRVPLLASNGYTGVGGLVDMTLGSFAFVTPINVSGSPLGGQQVQITTWKSAGNDRFLSTLANGGLVVGGGTPLVYDGQRLVELSFYSYPCVAASSAAQATVGGFMAPGVYGYAFTWEWVDSAGNRHQSPSCPPVTITVPVGTSTNMVTWTVVSLAATRKQISRDPVATNIGNDQQAPIRLVMYRTTAGGVSFTRHAISAFDDTAGLTITLVDTMSDAGTAVGATYPTLASGEALYDADGGAGKLFSTAPPCTLQPHVHLRRLWGIDQERTDRVWTTKTFEDLESPGYNPALQVTVPGCGRINGVAGQDGKIYALATEGIYLVSYGDGPSNTLQGVFPEPQLITRTATCTEPRSVCVGQEGIYFAGNAKWGTTLFTIRRGDGNPIDVGERVRDLFQSFPVVRGCHDRFDEDRVEVLIVDSDTAPTQGAILYYHYDFPDEQGIGIWTVALMGAVYSTGGAGRPLHCIGLWADDTVISTANSPLGIWVQQNTGNEQYSAGFTTADIRPFGLLGYGEVDGVTLLCSGDGVSSTIIITADYVTGGGNGATDTTRWSTGSEESGVPIRRWEQTLKKLPFASVQYMVHDSDATADPTGQWVTWHGLALDVTPLGGAVRLPATQEG